MLPQPTTTIEQVPAAAWQTWTDDNNAVILDVREPAEWATGTLPDSVKISLAFLPASVVCRAGNRSLVAAQFLQRNGFKSAANLYGGLTSIGLA